MLRDRERQNKKDREENKMRGKGEKTRAGVIKIEKVREKIIKRKKQVERGRKR